MTLDALAPDPAFLQVLRDFDFNLFLSMKKKGCPHCGGPLDTSNYLRKTRGLSDDAEVCFNLCCRREGCRKRCNPRSVRFLGRKVYGAWVVIMAMDYCRELGLSALPARRTIARWRFFWKEYLSEAGAFIRWARGKLVPGTKITTSPSSLFCHFGHPARGSWLSILKFFTQNL